MSSCVEYTLRIFYGCDRFIEIIHSDVCFRRNFQNSEVFYSVEISRTSSLRITEHYNERFKTDGNLKFAAPWLQMTFYTLPIQNAYVYTAMNGSDEYLKTTTQKSAFLHIVWSTS